MGQNLGFFYLACKNYNGIPFSNETVFTVYTKKAQVGKDQEKAQSEKDSHSKKPRWEITKLTIRYLFHENIS